MAALVALLAALALAAQLSPALASQLELSRAGLAAGQLWRLATGHLVHWSWDQLFWDLLSLVVLAWVAAGRSPARTALALGLAAVLVPAAVLGGSPALTSYGGLSGLDSALYVLAALLVAREAEGRGDPATTRLAHLALLGFLAKVGFEALTGATVFVASSEAVVVPAAHLAGALAGWLASRARLPAPPLHGLLCEG